MRNKTIAVIADKKTGVIKSLETEIIISQKELESEMRWECMRAIKKLINKKKYKIININTYFYDYRTKRKTNYSSGYIHHHSTKRPILTGMHDEYEYREK